MNIQNEIKNIIDKAVKQAIDELAIKEQIRSLIADSITKEEIVKKTDSLIDSYFRSAMNKQSVEEYVKNKMEELVKAEISREISRVVGSWNWSGETRVKDALNDQLKRELAKSFDISITIKPIQNIKE